MSYVRFGEEDSQVYCYESAEGYECCSCWLGTAWTHLTLQELRDHLDDHLAVGHIVPEFVFTEIDAELAAQSGK